MTQRNHTPHRLTYRAVLRLPNVRPLLLATCLARLAGRMFALAIVLYTLARFQSPVLAGWVAFLAFAPGMAISPIAGALLDRVGAARAIVVDMATGAMLVGALAASGFAAILSAPLLLALAGLFSLTGPLGAAGIRTLIPALVPAEARDHANALDSASFALIDTAGPALAGGLFGLAGGDATLLVIALLYAAAFLALLPLRHAGPSEGAPRRLLRSAIDGVVYVIRHRILRGLAVAYAFGQAAWGIMLVAVPVAAAHALGPGGPVDAVTGLVWAGDGLAACLGALLAGRLRSERRERHFMAAGFMLTACALWPLAALGLKGLVAAMALAGFFSGFIDVGVLTLRQRVTDPRWLGRTLSVSMSLNLSGLPIGSAIGGALAAWSIDAAFAVAAGAALLSSMLTWLMLKREA